MKDEHYWCVFTAWLVVLFMCNCGLAVKQYSYGDTTLTVFEPDPIDGGYYSGKVISTQDSGEL